MSARRSPSALVALVLSGPLASTPFAVRETVLRPGLPPRLEYMGPAPGGDTGDSFLDRTSFLDPTADDVHLRPHGFETMGRQVALEGWKRARELTEHGASAEASLAALEAAAEAFLWWPLERARGQLDLVETLDALKAEGPEVVRLVVLFAAGRLERDNTLSSGRLRAIVDKLLARESRGLPRHVKALLNLSPSPQDDPPPRAA